MPNYYGNSPVSNPTGPTESYDPNEPGQWKRVQRGGSFLCTDLYCGAYRPFRRMKTTPDTGMSHAGFRVVAEGPCQSSSLAPTCSFLGLRDGPEHAAGAGCAQEVFEIRHHFWV